LMTFCKSSFISQGLSDIFFDLTLAVFHNPEYWIK